MCMDKPKTAEFLKWSMAEMKSVLSRANDVTVAIESFQKENEILKTELDRVNKENNDLHAFIESVSMSKGDLTHQPTGKAAIIRSRGHDDVAW